MSALTAGPRPRTAARTAAADRAAGDDRTTRIAWLVGAAGASSILTVRSISDWDFWWHLALGRRILAQGIPSAEPFSFAGAPHPWIGQQWGYELILARLVDGVGTAAAMLVLGMVASLALLIAGATVWRDRRVHGSVLAGAVIVSAVVAGELLGVRGQVVSLLGFSLTLLLISRWRTGSRGAPWMLVPLIAVWANFHAGFLVAGLAVTTLAALTVAVWQRVDPAAAPAARPRTLALATAAAALASLANPAGFHLYGYVLDTFLNPTLTQSIVEWQSPDFHLWGLRFFELEVIAVVVAWILSRRADPLDVVLTMAMVALSLRAQRSVAMFAVIAIPQLAVHGSLALDRLRARRDPVRPRRLAANRPRWFAPALAALVVVGIAVIDVAPRLSSGPIASAEASSFPKGAADYVATHLRGHHLYSTYEWGGYLAERFPNDRMVYVYGESAVFGAERLDEYLRVHRLEVGWQDVLYTRGMRDAVVPATSPEVAALQDQGWIADCYDIVSQAVVLSAPATPPHAPIADLPPDARTASACS